MDIDVRKITKEEAGYPELLWQIPNPPDFLFVRGNLIPEDELAVAIVGTRAATPYGLQVARDLGGQLARAGLTIVSGMAEGIDGAAHEGALEAGGRTIAVLGHGLNHIYPPIHRELSEKIVSSGALVSQFPMEEKPSPWNFPDRNQVIAGLSLGVIVIEAPERSGALITARFAMEAGREVFAVPGPISSGKSKGGHALLRDGAKLVEDAKDVLEELAPQLAHRVKRWKKEDSKISLPHDETLVFEAVPVGSGISADLLGQRTPLEPSQLLSALTSLEIKGLIEQIPGQGYSRK